MATDLKRIGERARKEPNLAFTSLYHHIADVDNLRACYHQLKADKARGVDGVSKEEYGKNLEENLQLLSEMLSRMGYRPQPSLRSYIPKPGSDRKRPLGISSFEDKLVELSVKRTLELIYEEAFEDVSYGYRPGRSQHQCLDALGRTIQQERVSYVVEADIKGFFDNVNHAWMIKFLEHRIGDQRVLRLITRMLKSGIIEDGLVKASERGTPQGSILSPLLSNIYLHYVLDLWFCRRIMKQSRGEAYYFRFADDFLACFQYKSDAESFERRLMVRLEGFNLALSPEKTQSIEFGRFARENAQKRGGKPKEFTFLGFTHYCGKTRYGKFKVKRRTSRKKFGESLRNFTEWAERARRYLTKGEMLRKAKTRLCSTYQHHATRILFKWINRKSQRRSYTWEGFNRALDWVKWPKPNIRKDLNPFRRAEAI
ncbi:MAG: group II intron reverse transcriptase/maturase [Deltaproteobacteria bacterium]|nr:group II intron reverse transcriptase/maturase [Deltaproteobacteria bacterium]